VLYVSGEESERQIKLRGDRLGVTAKHLYLLPETNLEKIFHEITNLYPPFTQFALPLILTLLGTFVAFVQTLVFTLLSMIYISEVSHPPHDEHDYVHETHEPDAAVAHA